MEVASLTNIGGKKTLAEKGKGHTVHNTCKHGGSFVVIFLLQAGKAEGVSGKVSNLLALAHGTRKNTA
jgi:hypothetical protein